MWEQAESVSWSDLLAVSASIALLELFHKLPSASLKQQVTYLPMKSTDKDYVGMNWKQIRLLLAAILFFSAFSTGPEEAGSLL